MFNMKEHFAVRKRKHFDTLLSRTRAFGTGVAHQRPRAFGVPVIMTIRVTPLHA